MNDQGNKADSNQRMARAETLLEIVARDVKEMKDAQAIQIREIQAQKLDRTEFNRINSEYLATQVDMQEEIKELKDTIAEQKLEITALISQLKVWLMVGGGD